MAHTTEDFFSFRFLCIYLVILIDFQCNCANEGGLYKDSDPMVQFTNDTINGHLVGNEKAWIVEFYSSWCGHCQAFAPTWIRLALQLKNWNQYVNVGVLDCAAEKNYDTCKSFGITSYPTIKFFEFNWYNKSKDDDSPGLTFKGTKDIKNIRNGLIDHLELQRGGVFKRSVIPFHFFNVDDVQRYLQNKDYFTYKYLALLFEDVDSYLGKSLVLDTIKCKKLVVRRVSSSNVELTRKYGVMIFPALILINLRDGSFRPLSSSNRTHISYVRALNDITGDIINQHEDEKEKSEESKVINESDLEMAANISSEVYMQDLASAVAFSLRREVPKKKIIDETALGVLKDWVDLLVKCLPSEQYLWSFLKKLVKWLQVDITAEQITSKQYIDFLEKNQNWDSFLPMDIKWRGCQGSANKYRGFPCGLWTLFHAMSVRCGTTKTETSLSGYEVLKRIRGFVDQFFGCRHCRDHFMEMSKDLRSEVTNHEQAIIWLWSRHNRVNARLKKDISSDPLHPKVQFPSERICRECKKPSDKENVIVTSPGFDEGEIRWNRRVILEFLREHYSPDNIRVKDRVKSPNGDAESANADTVRSRFTYKFYSRTASPPFTLVGLSRLDMSFCVIIYAIIIGSVIGLYLYFIRRKRIKTYKSYV